jgi:endogenous inhibitor of DNA gyrase (YacG/DUF329 family)
MSGDEPARRQAIRPPRRCPICGAPATPDFYPFCSRRCSQVDLNRWLSGAYVIPARPADRSDDDGGAD